MTLEFDCLIRSTASGAGLSWKRLVCIRSVGMYWRRGRKVSGWDEKVFLEAGEGFVHPFDLYFENSNGIEKPAGVPDNRWMLIAAQGWTIAVGSGREHGEGGD